jgi:hypothetical protein
MLECILLLETIIGTSIMILDLNWVEIFEVATIVFILELIVTKISKKVTNAISINQTQNLYSDVCTIANTTSTLSPSKLALVVHQVLRKAKLTDTNVNEITNNSCFPKTGCNNQQEILTKVKQKGLKELKKQSNGLNFQSSINRFESLFDDKIITILTSNNGFYCNWGLLFQTIATASIGGVHNLQTYSDCLSKLARVMEFTNYPNSGKSEILRDYILIASKLLPTLESEVTFHEQMSDFITKSPNCYISIFSKLDCNCSINLENYNQETRIDIGLVSYQLICDYYNTINDNLQSCD